MCMSELERDWEEQVINFDYFCLSPAQVRDGFLLSADLGLC